MRATREDSGWNTDEPVPTSTAATSSQPKDGATDSSSRPASVKPIPTGSEYGLGWRSVYSPMKGCNSEGGQLIDQRDQADLRERQAESFLSIG